MKALLCSRMLLETLKANWTEVKGRFWEALQTKPVISPGQNKEVDYELCMQISRDGEMAGELIMWDFNYPDAESNENCGVVKKKKNSPP